VKLHEIVGWHIKATSSSKFIYQNYQRSEPSYILAKKAVIKHSKKQKGLQRFISKP